MSHVVKIRDLESRRSFNDAHLVIHYGSSFRTDRPCYPNRVAGSDYWYLSDEAHGAIRSSYSLSYKNPYWLISIDDPDAAVLFKLTWGG